MSRNQSDRQIDPNPFPTFIEVALAKPNNAHINRIFQDNQQILEIKIQVHQPDKDNDDHSVSWHIKNVLEDSDSYKNIFLGEVVFTVLGCKGSHITVARGTGKWRDYLHKNAEI